MYMRMILIIMLVILGIIDGLVTQFIVTWLYLKTNRNVYIMYIIANISTLYQYQWDDYHHDRDHNDH